MISDSRGFYDIYVPSLRKYLSFKEITTGQQKLLSKALMAEEGPYKTEFIKALIMVLNDNTIETTYVENFNIIDVMCIMLGLRCASISPNLNLTVTCNGCKSKHKINYELDVLYDKLIDHMKLNEKNSLNARLLKIKFPTLIKELELMYIFKEEKLDNKDFIVGNLLRFIDMPFDLHFFDEMEMENFQVYVGEIKKMSSIFNDIMIYRIECLGDQSKDITCNAVLRRDFAINYAVFYSFYNLIYNFDLKVLYKDLYYLSKLNIPPTYAEKLSAIDRSILWSVYSDEQKQKQKSRGTQLQY